MTLTHIPHVTHSVLHMYVYGAHVSMQSWTRGVGEREIGGDMVIMETPCNDAKMLPKCLPGVTDMILGRGDATFES